MPFSIEPWNSYRIDINRSPGNETAKVLIGVDRILNICGSNRFVPSKFEEIFGKHARTHEDALTSDELQEMLKSNRQPKDYRGWLVSIAFSFCLASQL